MTDSEPPRRSRKRTGRWPLRFLVTGPVDPVGRAMQMAGPLARKAGETQRRRGAKNGCQPFTDSGPCIWPGIQSSFCHSLSAPLRLCVHQQLRRRSKQRSTMSRRRGDVDPCRRNGFRCKCGGDLQLIGVIDRNGRTLFRRSLSADSLPNHITEYLDSG